MFNIQAVGPKADVVLEFENSSMQIEGGKNAVHKMRLIVGSYHQPEPDYKLLYRVGVVFSDLSVIR